MPFPLENAVDAQALAGALPPGVSLWWVRGKVLRSEVVERPVHQSPRTVYEQAKMAPYTQPDTLLALSDRDAKGQAYEIRLQGRVTMIAPGEELDLLGHITPENGSYLPRFAVSAKHNHWWWALSPLRQGQPGFIIEQNERDWKHNKFVSSYERETVGWLSVNAPNPAKAAPSAPAAAPASSPFGKLLGAVKQVAAATVPATVGVDLQPVYLWIYPALVAFGTQQAAEKPAPVAYADDSDDLPPM